MKTTFLEQLAATCQAEISRVYGQHAATPTPPLEAELLRLHNIHQLIRETIHGAR